jgi:Ala-tRNA(Pro) deacylase
VSPITGRLRAHLEEHGVSYDVLPHRPDYRARTTAEDTDTPPQEFAKSLLLWVDGRYLMAVLPASRFMSERRLRNALGARELRLATETELETVFPDCQIGAAPPFGSLYGLETYVSPDLAAEDHITFNAGSHDQAVRIRYKDFERLAKPHLVPMFKHDLPHE